MFGVGLAGLKERDSLALLQAGEEAGARAADLVEELARRGINLFFLSLGGRTRLCLEAERAPEVRELARRVGLEGCRLLSPVSLFTLYPLEQSLKLPAAAAAVLARAGLDCLALGTSPAALVLVVPGRQAERARVVLARDLNLAPGASPAREAVRVVAVPGRPED